LKFLARGLGLLLVAAGFIGLVVDGTRSIVNNGLSFAPLSGVVNIVYPGGVSVLEAKIAIPSYPWLWDPVFTNLLQVPASVAGFLIGALLLWLGQKPLEPIGYAAGR